MTQQKQAGMTRVEADIPMTLAGRFAVEAARQGVTVPQLVGMAAVAGAFGMAETRQGWDKVGNEEQEL